MITFLLRCHIFFTPVNVLWDVTLAGLRVEVLPVGALLTLKVPRGAVVHQDAVVERAAAAVLGYKR